MEIRGNSGELVDIQGKGKLGSSEVSNTSLEKFSKIMEDQQYNDTEVKGEAKNSIDGQEVKLPIQNKIDGLKREADVLLELQENYPEDKGYTIQAETYLRDKDGNILKDPVTGEARRIDYIIIKDGKVVDSIEVTSKTADKTEQSAKEDRIRENGGNYVKDQDGNLVEIPANVNTRIERRD